MMIAFFTPKAPARRKKRFSLSWRMVQMLLLCWIGPVLVFILIAGNVLLNNLQEQSVDNLTLTIEAASQLTTLRLEDAVAESRNASYIGTVKDAWTAYLRDDDAVALYQATRTFMVQEYQTNDTFYSTILRFYDLPDEPIYVINEAIGGTERIRDDADAIFAAAQSIGETLDTGIAFFSVGERIFMVRNVVNSSYEPIAMLIMELNTDLLFSEFAKIPNVQISATMIGGVAITTLWVEAADDTTVTVEDLSIDTSGESALSVNYHDDALYTVVRVIESDYRFSYYAISTSEVLEEQWDVIVNLLLIIFLLMLPLGTLVFRFFERQVTRPIRGIIEAANSLTENNYDVQIPEGAIRSQEIGALGDNFNEVSLTLKNQFERIYKEEIALRDARMIALQSQINPHFLNNTLEIINWEARIQGDLKVCNMIESLSIMLNAAMDRTSTRMVHLSQELMYVDAYLLIINERLGKRLVFERDIPDEFLDVMVPRLVLQPLLENAVEHGITPLQRGCIALRAYKEDDWLVLSVENDGAMSLEGYARVQGLLSDEESASALSSGSLGLRNVHQRLRILYGEESGLLVDITKKDMTTFKLKVKLDQP